jgi:hypothetical protein
MMDKQEIIRSTKNNSSSYSESSLLRPCYSSQYHAEDEERHGFEYIIGILDQALAIIHDDDYTSTHDDDPSNQEEQQHASCQSPHLLGAEAPAFLNLVLVEDRDAAHLDVDMLATGEDDDQQQDK